VRSSDVVPVLIPEMVVMLRMLIAYLVIWVWVVGSYLRYSDSI